MEETVLASGEKVTIEEALRRFSNREIGFFDMEYDLQKLVLQCNKEKNFGLKVLGARWYDVLEEKFNVYEFVYCEESLVEGISEGIYQVLRDFDTFDSFYDYVEGDIYTDSCFYGYEFSDDLKKKYSIDEKKLNFDSFIDETIETYTFDFYWETRQKVKGFAKEDADKIEEWIKGCGPIASLKQLEKGLADFLSEFYFIGKRIGEGKLAELFFSLIVRKEKETIKEAVFEFACNHANEYGSGFYAFGFDDILLTYGEEEAERFLKNYYRDRCEGDKTRQKYFRRFKDSIVGYKKSEFKKKRESGFDLETGFYFVEDTYYNYGDHYIKTRNYYKSFEEFVCAVDGSLCGADLSDASVSRELIEQYKTDDNTRYPLTYGFERYEEEKGYSEHFYVKQRWIGNDGKPVIEHNYEFKAFFDFAHFLRGDLSGADFSRCPWVGKILSLSGLVLDDIKLSSSGVKNDFFKDYWETKKRLDSRKPAKTKESEELFAGLEREKPYLPFLYDSDTWLVDFEDGIHEISKTDYLNFYRATNVYLEFHREFEKLYMIKREGTYLFLFTTKKGEIRILDGAVPKATQIKSLQFFYDNLTKYVETVNRYLFKYFSIQTGIARFLERIGGAVVLNGAQIEVKKDYETSFSLYLDPRDFSVFLESSSLKRYENLVTLLKGIRRDMYSKYMQYGGQTLEEDLHIQYNGKMPDGCQNDWDYHIYLKNLNKAVNSFVSTFKYKVVRRWNDSVIPDGTEESGKKIVIDSIFAKEKAKQ